MTAIRVLIAWVLLPTQRRVLLAQLFQRFPQGSLVVFALLAYCRQRPLVRSLRRRPYGACRSHAATFGERWRFSRGRNHSRSPYTLPSPQQDAAGFWSSSYLVRPALGDVDMCGGAPLAMRYFTRSPTPLAREVVVPGLEVKKPIGAKARLIFREEGPNSRRSGCRHTHPGRD